MKLHRSTTTSTTEEIPLYNSYPKETAVYAEIPEQNQLCSVTSFEINRECTVIEFIHYVFTIRFTL